MGRTGRSPGRRSATGLGEGHAQAAGAEGDAGFLLGFWPARRLHQAGEELERVIRVIEMRAAAYPRECADGDAWEKKPRRFWTSCRRGIGFSNFSTQTRAPAVFRWEAIVLGNASAVWLSRVRYRSPNIPKAS